jgi:phage terminase large subunit-like protein
VPNGSSPECGHTFDGHTCAEKGTHHCEPRADQAVAFFTEVLVHTKGQWARKRFDLADWQEYDIIRPLFGEVIWAEEWKCYKRRYEIAYVILARKNGKSELAAGVALKLLVADDEDGAEVYGAAKDTKQAGKVWEPAKRMVDLSALLHRRLGVNKHSRRIYDEDTASYYEVITSDAAGELGHNPHGVVIDELLTQSSGDLFDALRTAMGTRTQPLMLCISTETNDPSGFGAAAIDEAVRIQEDPGRAPHVFSYVRRLPQNDDELENLRRLYPDHPDLPVSTDWFEERNWKWPNPGLGDFLSLESLRKEALEARNDPTKENSFRQFRLNQRVQQVTRWLPLHVWDATAGMVVESSLTGRLAFGGLDLASTTDLAAWVLLFPGEEWDEVLWRFWTPEAQIPFLDRHTGGKASVWVREGLLEVTPGDWIDFEAIHNRMAADLRTFRVANVGVDPRFAVDTTQWLMRNEHPVENVPQGYGLSSALQELMRRVRAGVLRHGGHPVARWCADSAEVKRDDQEKIRLVKPERNASGKRVDGIAALADAIAVHQLYVEERAEMIVF